MSELMVALGGLGISGWLYSRVPDPRNIITILPLCFLGGAVLASLIGILAAKCKNTCSLVMHIGLSVLLLAGFGVICILSGLWLGGTTVIAPLLGNNITREDFSDFCENLSTIEENDAGLDDQDLSSF